MKTKKHTFQDIFGNFTSYPTSDGRMAITRDSDKQIFKFGYAGDLLDFISEHSIQCKMSAEVIMMGSVGVLTDGDLAEIVDDFEIEGQEKYDRFDDDKLQTLKIKDHFISGQHEGGVFVDIEGGVETEITYDDGDYNNPPSQDEEQEVDITQIKYHSEGMDDYYFWHTDNIK